MSEIMMTAETDEDFSKARHKALFNEVQHFLNPDEATLISLSDIKKLLKPDNEVYKGMMTVPVKLIVGSEARYRDFDNRFFPKAMHLKARWEHIDMAHIQDIPLPPISLYELGGLYFGALKLAMTTPTSFVPSEDQGVIFGVGMLPPGSSLERTQAYMDKVEKYLYALPEVQEGYRL